MSVLRLARGVCVRHKTHVLVPYTTTVACGAHNHTATGAFREQITCKLCRESDEFKRLRNRPRNVSR